MVIFFIIAAAAGVLAARHRAARHRAALNRKADIELFELHAAAARRLGQGGTWSVETRSDNAVARGADASDWRA